MGRVRASLRIETRSSYLDRLGLEVEPPSAEALFRLHRRHAERIPYETLWIHAGESWGIDAIEAADRIAFFRGAAVTATTSTAASASCSSRSATGWVATRVAFTVRTAPTRAPWATTSS